MSRVPRMPRRTGYVASDADMSALRMLVQARGSRAVATMLQITPDLLGDILANRPNPEPSLGWKTAMERARTNLHALIEEGARATEKKAEAEREEAERAAEESARLKTEPLPTHGLTPIEMACGCILMASDSDPLTCPAHGWMAAVDEVVCR